MKEIVREPEETTTFEVEITLRGIPEGLYQEQVDVLENFLRENGYKFDIGIGYQE